MSKSLAFFQGKIVPIEQAKVGVMTHALHYGTAVFEGIRGNWNAERETMYVFRMREHYDRLLQGCRMMMMDIPYKADDLCAITEDLIKASGHREDVYIRPLVYKSEELVANLKLHEIASDFTLIIVPFGAYIESDGAIKCCTSSWRRMDDTIIPPRVKISGHYVNSILAKTEAVLAGFDEAIMLNQDGGVSEGTGENLFLISGGKLHTPLVSENNLVGITRDCTWTIATQELGLEVVERSIRRSELYLADEVFLTGTAAHITPVGSVDNRPVGDGGVGPITDQLRSIYAEAVRGNRADYMHWCHPVALEPV
jgi:branched-chain amino acid aminotransferase